MALRLKNMTLPRETHGDSAISPATRKLEIATVAFLVLCAGWYLKENVWAVRPTSGASDFGYYYAAALHVLSGESPFEVENYIYPPLLAFLCTPLALFDYVTARWIWFVVSHTCFLGAAYLLWQRLGKSRVAACAIAFVWAAGGAAQDAFGSGQPDHLLLLLCVAAITRCGWRQGFAVGAGFAVKLLPGVLGLLPVFERRWRALWAAVAMSALLTALPWAAMALFLEGPHAPARADYLAGTPSLLNWSVPAVALRAAKFPAAGDKLSDQWVNGWDLPRLRLSSEQRLISLGAAVAVFGAGVLALWAAAGGRITSEQSILAAALLALTLAASPLSWWHYQVLQYPGVVLLLVEGVRQRRWPLLAATLTCAALAFPLTAAVLRGYYSPHDAWPNLPGTLFFWTALPAVGSLGLFAMLLQETARGRTSGGGRGIRTPE